MLLLVPIKTHKKGGKLGPKTCTFCAEQISCWFYFLSGSWLSFVTVATNFLRIKQGGVYCCQALQTLDHTAISPHQ